MMVFRNRFVRFTLVVLIFWLALLLPALACNFPIQGSQSLPMEQLRQTLTALPVPNRGSLTIPPNSIEISTPGPFRGLQTATPPGASQPPIPTPDLESTGLFLTYLAQSGDTLASVARRFGVNLEQITSPQSLQPENYLAPGQPLFIPNVLKETPYPSALLPDSEVIDSPSTVDFNVQEAVQSARGFLSAFSESVDGETISGAEIVQRVAVETSINPRLLLAFLEYRSGWVLGQPEGANDVHHPIGFYVPGEQGLYKELYLAAKFLAMGYYGWRSGSLTYLEFSDEKTIRLSPGLNAGSVALQYLFAPFYRQADWEIALYGSDNFFVLYNQMFGDPWGRATAVEPLLPPGLAQPQLELPFAPGERWSFTGGPHFSCTTGTPRGGLDFSPVTGAAICATSQAWVTASAPGLVVRARHDVVVIDLDGDGFEQTGWVLLYLHIPEADRALEGSWVQVDDRLGHPSCERGKATGTHVHMARKYNGEWLPADGPLPFVLSGWEVEDGAKAYQGYLKLGEQVITANPGGARSSIIIRDN